MAFWIVFAFLLGLAVGAGVTWWLFGGPTIPSSTATTSRPTREPETAPDSMSLTAKRLVSDLERKYEGAVAGDEEGAARPKRPRAKRAPRRTPEEPADPA